ncbi:MAG TPA: choice-of-anchor D domain-containing protein [Kofleriaceae bacterium]|nr:choice-of-anchor D domain-containing protein [Kofleriaceae bacterium]
MTGSPDPLVYEGVRVGTPANATQRLVALTNAAETAAQNVTCSITSVDPPATDFFVQSCPASIVAGGLANVAIRFPASIRGLQQATLTINYEILTVPLSTSVGLVGTGIAPEMVVSVIPATEPLDFGSVPVGDESPTTYTIRVENTGDDVLDAALTESGANVGDWTYDPPAASIPVGPGLAHEMVATFIPGAAGARSATVTLTDADGLSTVPSRSFDLIGNGEPPLIGLGVSPTALTFGALDVQVDEPVTRTVTVTNPGNQELVISPITLRGLDGLPYEGGQFQIATRAPVSIPPGGQQVIDVTYAPTVESSGDFAVLVLGTNVVETPEVQITLSGRGVDRHIEVSPLRIAFEPTYRNPASPPEAVLEVRNTGETPLVLGEIMTEGDGAAASSFVIVGELAQVIEPQGTSSVVIQFHPRAAPEQPLQAALLIVNDDDSQPIARVDLSGTGILPPIDVTYTSINWGTVAVGLELPLPGAASFTLSNQSSTEAFLIQEVRVVDEAGELLDGVRADGVTEPRELGPGEQLVLDVGFAPRRGGVYDGAIEVLIGPDPEPVVRVPFSATAISTDARGGAGCSAAGAGSAGWLALAVLLALRRRRGPAAALLLALSAGSASAQVQVQEDVDLASFRPVHAVNPAMVTVESTDVGEPGYGALGLAFDYARNPLVLRAAGGDMVDHPVSSRTSVELAGAYAFGERFEAAAVVPFLTQTGEAPQFSGIEPADGPSLGDVRVRGKVFIGGGSRLRFASSAELTLPSALDKQFAGQEGPSAQVRMLGDYRSGRLHLALNAGAVMRERVRLVDVEQGHAAVYGAAAAVQFSPRWHGVAELFGSADFSGGPTGARPLEAVLATRLRVVREVGLLVGAGRGIVAGVGVPEVRVFMALGWSPGARPIAGPGEDPRAMTDDDRDGVVKRDDRCPDEMEDLDGFQDADGCLDRDDDRDGVPDSVDRCPRRAEDLDKHDDDDGCPEGDNDGDRVPDRRDGCPEEAEDADEFEDEDGCPDPDNDSDGIDDVSDRCADQMETINGNQDDDGCPDSGDSVVVVMADKIATIEAIRFRGEGSALTRASQRLLGQVGATLRAHRDIVRVRIRAHVHPRGAGDEELSVARAEAVRRWLVEWGIESSRIEGVGFGSRQPLLSGDSVRARTMNDRIELEVVERRRRR